MTCPQGRSCFGQAEVESSSVVRGDDAFLLPRHLVGSSGDMSRADDVETTRWYLRYTHHTYTAMTSIDVHSSSVVTVAARRRKTKTAVVYSSPRTMSLGYVTICGLIVSPPFQKVDNFILIA